MVQLDLSAHPPGAEVQKPRLEAEAVRPQHLQEGMFVPQRPEPQQLQVTLARLRKIVGEGRAGSPEIIEQHTTQTFRMVHFKPDPRGKTGAKRTVKKSALRVYRPHRRARVRSEHGAPSFVQFENQRYRVGDAAGPWRRSGQWWTEHRWGRDEWDLVLDLVGNRSLSDCLRAVHPRGTYISCGGGSPDRSSWDLLAGMLQNAVRSAFTSQKMPGLFAKINREDLAILADLVQRETVIPVVDRNYSLREVAEAVRHVESGHVSRKSRDRRYLDAPGASSPALYRLSSIRLTISSAPID
jgi:hypothetical protein